MSEIFELSSLLRAAASEEKSVVLPFPAGEAAAATSETRFTKPRDAGSTSPLIRKLCDALNAQQISYCHWKSNWRLSFWLTGEGDLDLLVDRADAQRFVAIIHSLGFKQAEPPSDRGVPGILNFYGFDSATRRFIHLHVHYQLVIGHDLTKNYHLPIQSSYLENSIRHGLVPTPEPEFEFIVFVLRMVLKHSMLESMARSMFGRVARTDALEQELEQLESQVDHARVANLLPSVAPAIDYGFFNSCVESLRSGNPLWTRTRIRQELERRLKTCARQPQTADAISKLGRRVTRLIDERLFRGSSRKRFVAGGLLIALVGGDGAGKTTTLGELNRWLSKKFLTRRFHLGKPPRSAATFALIVLLRIRRLVIGGATHPERLVGTEKSADFPGYLQLLRWVSAGRDRCRHYAKARRFAANGGIALCDRYPLPQVRLMEGPNIARTIKPDDRNALVKRLLKAETNYYLKMMLPDLLIVLRVEPEVAVKRKTTESEHHVRVRSTELWEQDWTSTNAYVIDASRPLDEVVGEAQSVIWSKL
jgi:thymidylate kinase